jgi:hypothetical protein
MRVVTIHEQYIRATAYHMGYTSAYKGLYESRSNTRARHKDYSPSLWDILAHIRDGMKVVTMHTQHAGTSAHHYGTH